MSIEEETSTVLVRALQHLLRPIVRLLVAQGILYPDFASLLKTVYLDVALREFPLEGKRQTDSRLSLLTGVHRKDVRTLRSQTGARHRAPASVSLGAQVVARWTGDPHYHDTEGRPRPLIRTAQHAGGDPSFEELVASVSRDIRPRSVLDEWRRLGVATLDAEDRVCLNAEAFVPSRGFHEKLYYYARNLHDHAATGTHNLLDREPPLLDPASTTPRSVESVLGCRSWRARRHGGGAGRQPPCARAQEARRGKRSGAAADELRDLLLPRRSSGGGVAGRRRWRWLLRRCREGRAGCGRGCPSRRSCSRSARCCSRRQQAARRVRPRVAWAGPGSWTPTTASAARASRQRSVTQAASAARASRRRIAVGPTVSVGPGSSVSSPVLEASASTVSRSTTTRRRRST